MNASMSDEAIADVAAPIDGWMTRDQGHRLARAARRCPPGGRIVEIGSFRGKSTVVLALASAPGVDVIAIDPHAGTDRGPEEIAGFEEQAATDHDLFRGNLERAGVSDRVRHVREFSDAAHPLVDDPIDVLYVDGAHRYRPALADVRDWGRRLSDGGTLLVHDAFSSIGVTAAIVRHLCWSSRFRYVGRSRSLAEFTVVPAAGLLARTTNAARVLAQLPWFARNLALKVLLTLGLGRLLERLGRRTPEWPY